MTNTNRLTHAAETLRTMATNPVSLDLDKLLAVADELDQIHDSLPSDVHFVRGVLGKYKSKN